MRRPPRPSPLGDAEQVLFEIYINCQLSITDAVGERTTTRLKMNTKVNHLLT